MLLDLSSIPPSVFEAERIITEFAAAKGWGDGWQFGGLQQRTTTTIVETMKDDQVTHHPDAMSLASQYPPHDPPANKPNHNWRYAGQACWGKAPGRWYYLNEFQTTTPNIHGSDTIMGAGSGHYFVEDLVHDNCPQHVQPPPPLGKMWVYRGWDGIRHFLEARGLEAKATACYTVDTRGHVSGPFVRSAREFITGDPWVSGWIAVPITEEGLYESRKSLGITDTGKDTLEAPEHNHHARTQPSLNVHGAFHEERGTPKTVFITGNPATAWEDMALAARRYELDGWLVHTKHVDMIPSFSEPGMASDAKRRLDALQLRKIGIADLVFVCDTGGLTPSVRNEIAHAIRHKRPVRFDSPAGIVDLLQHDETTA